MELVYSSDFHGSAWHYEQLLLLLQERSCDVLVLGGDILPDGDRGMPYGAVCAYIRRDFRQFLQRVREIEGNIDVLTVFGNHDWIFSVEEFAKLQSESLLRMLDHQQLITIAGIDFLGLSHSPPAPYWIKDFERRDLTNDPPTNFGGYTWSPEKNRIVSVTGRRYFTEKESLEQMLAETPAVDRPMIFVAHAPPCKSNLDYLEGGEQVGSCAVRRYIEKVGPLLSLHGHLHESPIESGHFTDRINDCLCVNPGQKHTELCAIRWNSEQPDHIEHTLGWKP